LIDHLRGLPAATGLLRQAVRDGDELWSVVVVRTEVLAGMRPTEARATFQLLDVIRWQDVTVELADRAGGLAATYLRSHPGVDTVDYLVAATALHVGAELWTKNTRHFPMFRDLAAPY
jgi:hypothetical protein